MVQGANAIHAVMCMWDILDSRVQSLDGRVVEGGNLALENLGNGVTVKTQATSSYEARLRAAVMILSYDIHANDCEKDVRF